MGLHRLSAAEVSRETGISKQILSYVLSGKREMSIDVAVRLDSAFSLPEGAFLRLQAEDAVDSYREHIRSELCTAIRSSVALWSYEEVQANDLSDDDIIENTFLYLDMPEIAMMMRIFRRDKIKQVWKDRLVVQGEYLHDLNVMIARLYFGIKKPDRYLKAVESQFFNKLNSYV
jgi:Helix-turn-helix.